MTAGRCLVCEGGTPCADGAVAVCLACHVARDAGLSVAAVPEAAARSVAIPPGPDGRRPGDPLVALFAEDPATLEQRDLVVRLTWCRSQIGLVSPMRKAAGLAKVDPALERIADWLRANADIGEKTGSPVHGEPLVVWAHHREVMDRLRERIPDLLGEASVSVGLVDGRTGQRERERLVDAFQAGALGVLICQIAAAGVGITLTAASEALFVETDWTPALIVQAEDRIARIGQTRPCGYSTLVAAGTLDEHIVRLRHTKEDTARPVVGGAGATATRDEAAVTDAGTVAWQIAARLADEAIRGRKKRRRRSAV